jgi:hypothetical protein
MSVRRTVAALALALGTAAAVLHAQPVPTPAEVRLGFVGDQGTGGTDQKRVRDQMLRFPSSLMFLLGDNVYDRGSRSAFAKKHDAVYLPVMARGTSFHAALGNHDVSSCDASTRDPLPADHEAYVWNGFRCDARAHLQHPLFGYLGGRRYYSVVTDGSAQPLGEVFVLDSNTLHTSQSKLSPLRSDRAQLEWLDRALARSRARWKIVALHHPPHSPTAALRYFFFVPLGGGRGREILLEQQLRPILERHRVDVVMGAHNHFYARMLPQNGIRYFVVGGGGREIYAFDPAPGYVAAGGRFHHFLAVRLTFETFEYYAIDADGRSRDAGRFTKGAAIDQGLPPGTLPPPIP